MTGQEEKEAKRLEAIKKQEAEIKKHKSNFEAVAATEEGRYVFKYLMENCSFQKNMISFNPQTLEINKGASDYLEARRSVYLDVRKNISAKYLKLIEF